MATIPAPHALLDLTCPHCHKMSLLAVVPAQGKVATVSMQSSAPIARKSGRHHFLGQLYPGRFPSDSLHRIPVKDYGERSGDIVSAIRALRRSGMRLGLPHQTTDGIMFFELDEYTLTVAQILELLDKHRLDRESIRALVEAQKK